MKPGILIAVIILYMFFGGGANTFPRFAATSHEDNAGRVLTSGIVTPAFPTSDTFKVYTALIIRCPTG